MQVSCGFYFMAALMPTMVLIVNVQAWWTNFDFEKIGNSKTGVLKSDIKVTRASKTTYALSGTMEIAADLKDNYDCEEKAYFSKNGNNQYVLLPFKIARDSCCNFMDSWYFKQMDEGFRNSTNFPVRNDANERLCFSYVKGSYEVRKYTFDYSAIWKFLEAGSYKFQILIYEKNSDEASSVLNVIARLY